ncbi:hypothetical protein GGR56DRAFT_663112 [Xylariaceae sp. FL0804]|nr:hypothetical protein GGR56DRAFT_663112 [Xylariaceae sp. FL0804]
MALPSMAAVALLLLAVVVGGVDAGEKKRLSTAAQSLFDYSMSVGDSRYDSYYNYIWSQEQGAWSTRFTAWYIPGLLHRAQGDDVQHGIAAIESVLATQYLDDYESAWYGTFKHAPDEPTPTPNSSLYPPEVYTTYDPNWREFVGTQLIQVVEEFGHLLSDDLIGRVEDSLEAAAVGGMRRNGSYPADDNLDLAYSNPQLMRCLTVGWIGTRRGNQTLVDFAAGKGRELLALFERGGQDVLAEYNAPTYYGVDLWALAANMAYGPADLPMTSSAATIMRGLWRDVADHYNPFLGNFAGPYDRAYTRDITTNSAIISLFWWGLWGYDHAPVAPKGNSDLLYDIAQGAALALIMDVTSQHVDDAVAAKLTAKGAWEGSRFVNRTVYNNVTGGEARVATSWLSAPLMIGAETVPAETAGRGEQFVPAIVHWAADPRHTPWPYAGMLMLYPTAATVAATAGPRSLDLAYPNATQAGADLFTLALTGIPPAWSLDGRVTAGLAELQQQRRDDGGTGTWTLPCLRVNVSAPGLELLPVAYGYQLEDHYIYNVSYAVPSGFEGTPAVRLEFEYTCAVG